MATEEEYLVAPGDRPDDPAGPSTPVARSGADVTELADGAAGLGELTARQSVCRACPRLVAWREHVAVTRRRAFRDERYWGRPVPGWGSERPRLLIVGLAPAAHGGNRTGRIFTGDRSGDFLFASLYRTGFAVQPTSVAAGDGQRLLGARMAAAVRCAPPDNKPEPAERDTCAPWLVAELRRVTADLRAIVCLGGFAWQAIWPAMSSVGFAVPRPRPAFGHGAEARLTSSRALHGVLIIGCYHPSQQNTFTGRVTPAMLDAIFIRARAAAGLEGQPRLRSAKVDHVISYAARLFPKNDIRVGTAEQQRTDARGGVTKSYLPAARAVPRPDDLDERRLRSVETQPPTHLVLVHDRVGVAARDAGFVG